MGIPFCPTRCAYCSFVSNSVEKSFHLVEPYLEALLAEVDSAAEMVRDLGLRVKSFYMGGGTPTTLSAEQMDRLLGRLGERFELSRTVERTVEAGRPDTITAEKLAVLGKNGVNRISVNPQSMDDAVLSAIGRRHGGADIRRAMELVGAAGFPHVNMDLIAGLPEDSPAVHLPGNVSTNELSVNLIYLFCTHTLESLGQIFRIGGVSTVFLKIPVNRNN